MFLIFRHFFSRNICSCIYCSQFYSISTTPLKFFGLAKKKPDCVPPGLAKKGVTAEDRGYDIGDRIEDADYIVLREGERVIFEGREYVVVDTNNGTVLRRGDDRYRLPRSSSSDYVRIGGSLIKVDRQTKEVVDLIRIADLILG